LDYPDFNLALRLNNYIPFGLSDKMTLQYWVRKLKEAGFHRKRARVYRRSDGTGLDGTSLGTSIILGGQDDEILISYVANEKRFPYNCFAFYGRFVAKDRTVLNEDAIEILNLEPKLK